MAVAKKAVATKVVAKKVVAKKVVAKKVVAKKVVATKAPVTVGEGPGLHLVKSEPFKYPFAQLVADGRTFWDGVRNFEARNKLRGMRVGDLVLYYHSNEGKEVVGVAKVVREAYPDPTSEEDWSVVDLAPVRALPRPVPLATIRESPLLAGMEMMRRNRLSVTTVTAEEFREVLRLGGIDGASLRLDGSDDLGASARPDGSEVKKP